MGAERQDVGDAELVVGDEALHDDEGADHDRDVPGGVDVAESEDPWRGDEEDSCWVVEHAVHATGDWSRHARELPPGENLANAREPSPRRSPGGLARLRDDAEFGQALVTGSL